MSSSSPAPPTNVSSPSAPTSVSLPSPPSIKSGPNVPLSESSPPRPSINALGALKLASIRSAWFDPMTFSTLEPTLSFSPAEPSSRKSSALTWIANPPTGESFGLSWSE
jgi:hypothetical protein